MPQNFIRRLPFAAFAYVLFLSIAASAAERDAFRVDGVEINAQAGDELAAKSLGLTKGKQAALRLLLQRLAAIRDYDRLPDANTKTLNSLIRDFSLVGERFGGGRYLASLTVRFNPSQVRALLRKAGIPFAETQSRPILVLPVYQRHGADLLWDNPNPWFDAWRRAVEGNPQNDQSLLPLILPRGDFSDLTVISAAQASSGVAQKLAAIMRKYDAAGVLIPVASPSATVTATTLKVSIMRFGGDLDGVAPPPRPLEFETQPDESQPDALLRAATQVIANAVETWKSANMLTSGAERSLQVIAPLTDFKSWLTLRRRLDRVASLIKINIARLSIKEATLALRFRGDAAQLKIAMAQRNLDLSYSNDASSWILRLR
ncbi:MAG: DUF2066 domain-containing protein [Alphaproteobacteria bacterium]|nr:DUF2066 domain-containing protein [Alphaproteobacteria bacterium]